jgi:phthiocerol/phenolphthiocerol synthesis type-I polyketide synthase A
VVVDGAAMTQAYWVDNLREPVLFADRVTALSEDGVSAFIEMSPHPILLPAIEQVVAERGAETAVLPSLRRNESERDVLLASLGRLHVLGVPIRLDRVVTPAAHDRKLPHYPWARTRPRFRCPPTPGSTSGSGSVRPVAGDLPRARRRPRQNPPPVPPPLRIPSPRPPHRPRGRRPRTVPAPLTAPHGGANCGPWS